MNEWYNLDMSDPNNKRIEEIKNNLTEINQKLGGTWKSLFRGLLTGFGSVLGAALAIILIGYLLNIVGVIPAFKQQADDWKEILQQSQTRAIVPANQE